MEYRDYLKRLIDARTSKNPARVMDDDVRELIDLSREDDLDSRVEKPSRESDGIKDVDELAAEPSSLAPMQEQATDSAIFNTFNPGDDSEIPEPEPESEFVEDSSEEASLTTPFRDAALVPAAKVEEPRQSAFDESQSIVVVPDQLDVNFDEVVASIEQDLRLNIDNVTLYDQEVLDPRSLIPEIPESFYFDNSRDMHIDSNAQMAQERRS